MYNRKETALGDRGRRAISEWKMFRRSFQLLSLLLVTALLVSSQCVAMCAVSGCTASASHSSQCHHDSQKSHDDSKTCRHLNPDFFSPERSTDLVQLPAFHSAGVVGLACSAPSAELYIRLETETLQQPERRGLHATSVLALLSALRI